MKEAIKDAKWWMFLPFACVITFKMSRWVFEGETLKDRHNRYTFMVCNLMLTTIIMAFIMGFLGLFK